MSCILKRAACFCLAFMLTAILCVSWVVSSHAKDQTSERRIAIVLDNSDSMIIIEGKADKQSYVSRWAEATHALKTFLYMVEDTDTIGLFTVAGDLTDNATNDKHRAAATISDNINRGNITEQLKNVGISYQTKTYGLDAAYAWVKEGGKDVEKWVVILSDGEFYPENSNRTPLSYMESVGKRAAENNQNDIHTIFVGLEIENSDDFEDLRNSGLLSAYTTESATGEGIQETILRISEEIYGMNELNWSATQASNSTEFNYDSQNRTLTWATQPGLSSYLQQVIIIAQTDQLSTEKPEDVHLQVIHSDTAFSWCSTDGLEKVLAEHDDKAGSGFDFGSIQVFQDNIQSTFLNQDCYIYSYSGNELGEELSIQLPEGADVCRIYYELREDITPNFTIHQNKVEFSPESDGSYIVPEGTVDIDYVLYARGALIPKDLQVIAPELGEIHVTGEGFDDTGNQHSFSYCDGKNNSYAISTAFHGKETIQTMRVEPDVQSYDFNILQGQTLNIDRLDENHLLIETNLPANWLNSHLKGSLQVMSEAEGGHLLFDVNALELLDEADKTEILIPVQTDDSKLDLNQVFPVNAVLEVGSTNRREAKGELRFTQETPEIKVQETGTAAKLDKLFENNFLAAKIIATVDGEEVHDNSVELVDWEVEGLGNLDEIPLEYDADRGEIYIKAYPFQRFRLLLGSSSQGEAILRAGFYRNGIEIDPNLECMVPVSWTGNLWVLIFKCILFLLILAFAGVLLWAAAKGCLMFQEFFSRLLGDSVRNNNYFLYWSVNDQLWEVTCSQGLYLSPIKMSLLFLDLFDIRSHSGSVLIELEGTAEGYRITDKSQSELSAAGIQFRNWHLDREKDALEFLVGDKACSLVYCRKRSRAFSLVLTVLVCILVVLLACRIL